MVDRKHVVLIDSGDSSDTGEILDYLERENLKVAGVINTHGHIDHIGANYILKRKYGCKIATPNIDHACAEDLSHYYLNFTTSKVKGLMNFGTYKYETDIIIKDKDNEVTLLNTRFKIHHTPGHTNGHVSLGHLTVCFSLGTYWWRLRF
jgi:glyoxylase-like metal-dependent hydrolase (beta-lactamase superfamily II)